MGTYIKVEVVRGEKLPFKDWLDFQADFKAEYEDIDVEDEYYIGSSFGCSYSFADLERIVVPFKEKWRDKDILFNMWYEEREPDESLNMLDVSE